MKRIIFLLVISSIIMIPKVHACDACGCTASNLGIGLLTNYRSNFIRFSYFNTHFKNVSKHHKPSSDLFEQYDISIRYALGRSKKFRLMAHLPYGVNSRIKTGGSHQIQGLSDSRFVLNYVLLNNVPIGRQSMFYLEAGGGMSLPTGKFNSDISKESLPENFNLGKGALGYIAQMNAVYSNLKFGVLFSNHYQTYSGTASGYHYGDQWNSQILVYRNFLMNDFEIVPNLGLAYEKTMRDQYENHNNVPETGGNGVFLTGALNLKTEKWLTGISYNLPLYENYANGMVEAKGRIAVQLAYLF